MTLSERRLRFLDELFGSGKSYSKKELEEKVSNFIAPFRNRQEINDNGLDISKRAIDYDIRRLREEYQAPLVCIKRKYYYTNPDFSIQKPEIDSDSLQNIQMASAILKQIPGLEFYKDLMEICAILDSQNVYNPNNDRTYIQFDTRPRYEGNKYLLQVLEACKTGSVIGFDYQSFKADQPSQVILHPYLIKQYNNRWFLIGMTESARKQEKYEISQFGLERIKGKVKNEKIEYFYHPNFKPDEYLANVIGVSAKPNAVVEKVILRFTLDRAKYIATNPIHHTQKNFKELDEKAFRSFSYELTINQELESLVLSFGLDVTVVEPIKFKEKIKAIVLKIGESYL